MNEWAAAPLLSRSFFWLVVVVVVVFELLMMNEEAGPQSIYAKDDLKYPISIHIIIVKEYFSHSRESFPSPESRKRRRGHGSSSSGRSQ